MSTTITPTEQNIEINVNNDVIDINVTNEIVDVNATTQQIDINVAGAYPIPNPVLSVFGRTGVVVATEGDYTLTQLGDVTLTSPTNGQVLKYNGTTWVNGTDAGGLTSVGLSMPTAFTVTNSPLTSNGTIAVTGAGTTAEYVRGDGTLATFPSLTGFVPYTGATGQVNLGAYDLLVQTLTIGKGNSSLANNTALGYRTLFHITTGNYNTAVGYESSHNTTTGQYNTSLGQSALFTNTTGSQNTAIGLNALLLNTTGGSNVVVGLDALQHNTTGSSNTALGYNAGSHITGGSTPNTTASSSVYIGRDTKAKVDGGTNEIVIGYNAIGNGSNTATFGNTSTTANYFTGSINGGSFVKSGGTSSQFLKADGSVDSTSYQPILTNPITGTGTTNTLPKFTGASTIGNSNITDTGSLITLGSNTYVTNNLGLGNSSLTQYGFRNSLNITGAGNSTANYSDGQVLSGVIGRSSYYETFANTAAASFTNAALYHYRANQSTFGAGSSVTSQYGYSVESTLIGATNNYGFFGNIPSGTNRWNIYMNGTANNYLAGALLLNTTTDGGFRLDVNGTARVQGNLTLSGQVNAPASYQTNMTGGNVVYFVRENILGSGDCILKLQPSSTSGVSIVEGLYSGGLGLITNLNTAPITFAPGRTERARIFNTGNFAIGTTTDLLARLQVSGSITASSAIARGQLLNTTLVAAANNDVLVGLDINPTFTNGAFTNVANVPIRLSSVRGGFMWLGATTTGNSGVGFQAYQFTTNDTTNVGTMIVAQRNASGSGTALQVQQLGTGLAFNVSNLGSSLFNSSITASSAIARGVRVENTLVAAANNDVLVGLDINPTFTNGAFTGVSNVGLRVQSGGINVTGNSSINGQLLIGSTTLGINPFLQINSNGRADIVLRTNGTNDNAFSIYAVGGAYGSNYAEFGTNNGLNAANQGGAIYTDSRTGLVPPIRFAVKGTGTTTMSIAGAIQSNGNWGINTTTDAGFRLDVNGTARVQGAFTVTGSTTAASAIARGANFTSTLVAAANNDVLVGLDINPTFTAGAFTGTSRYVLRTNAPYVSLQNPQVRFSSATTASAFELVRFSGATESHKFQFITGYNGPQLELFAQSSSGGTYDVNVMSFFRNGNIVINSTADVASSILTIESTTKGVLFPRMTTTQKTAISSPATGLVVYDTTLNKLSVYTGAAWETVTSL